MLKLFRFSFKIAESFNIIDGNAHKSSAPIFSKNSLLGVPRCRYHIVGMRPFLDFSVSQYITFPFSRFVILDIIVCPFRCSFVLIVDKLYDNCWWVFIPAFSKGVIHYKVVLLFYFSKGARKFNREEQHALPIKLSFSCCAMKISTPNQDLENE